jgi:hypothetical protein
MELPRQWVQMDAQELRDLATTLIAQLAERDASSVSAMMQGLPAAKKNSSTSS